jgi:5-methylcytosine-specific restriction endonuclease McrA
MLLSPPPPPKQKKVKWKDKPYHKSLSGPVEVIPLQQCLDFKAEPKKPSAPRVKKPIISPEKALYIASPAFLESYDWRELRMKALIKYGRKCQCCGDTPENGAIMNVDHIKCRKKHPELALDINNLQIMCQSCNHGKGNWDDTDWR